MWTSFNYFMDGAQNPFSGDHKSFLVIQKNVLTYNIQESKPKHNVHKSTKKCTNIFFKINKHTWGFNFQMLNEKIIQVENFSSIIWM
jgi:hypothetical protein